MRRPFWPPHGLDTGSAVLETAFSVELHISRERLRVKRRTIANNSNRRITILVKTLSLSLAPPLHLHASLIVCGYLIVCG